MFLRGSQIALLDSHSILSEPASFANNSGAHTTPGKYLGSNPFRIKMTLLSLALVFHFGVLRKAIASAPGSRPRWVNVTIACLSLTLWFSVGWAGRAIAFVP